MKTRALNRAVASRAPAAGRNADVVASSQRAAPTTPQWLAPTAPLHDFATMALPPGNENSESIQAEAAESGIAANQGLPASQAVPQTNRRTKPTLQMKRTAIKQTVATATPVIQRSAASTSDAKQVKTFKDGDKVLHNESKATIVKFGGKGPAGGKYEIRLTKTGKTMKVSAVSLELDPDQQTQQKGGQEAEQTTQKIEIAKAMAAAKNDSRYSTQYQQLGIAQKWKTKPLYFAARIAMEKKADISRLVGTLAELIGQHHVDDTVATHNRTVNQPAAAGNAIANTGAGGQAVATQPAAGTQKAFYGIRIMGTNTRGVLFTKREIDCLIAEQVGGKWRPIRLIELKAGEELANQQVEAQKQLLQVADKAGYKLMVGGADQTSAFDLSGLDKLTTEVVRAKPDQADAKNADAKSADTKSGDTKSGDTKSAGSTIPMPFTQTEMHLFAWYVANFFVEIEDFEEEYANRDPN
jgi:hypothetical protein